MTDLTAPRMLAEARRLVGAFPDSVRDVLTFDQYDDLVVAVASALRLAWYAGAQAGIAETQRIIQETRT